MMFQHLIMEKKLTHTSGNSLTTINESKDVNKYNVLCSRNSRNPIYIPPIKRNALVNVEENIVTIDTSKARGNVTVVRMVARELGWREVTHVNRDQICDISWHAIDYYDQPNIRSKQVNKFPGALEIFYKINLFRQLLFMQELFPNDYNFFPRTWILPIQYNEFTNDVRQISEQQNKEKRTFIIKPSGGSQGGGIYLIREPKNYFFPLGKRTDVAQEYLADVLLIDGFKFDLRVYVVLKSLDPLRIYICDEGLARLSTILYEPPNNRNIRDVYMHLTNYTLNRKNAAYIDSSMDDAGSKRKMSSVFSQLETKGVDTKAIWQSIEAIVCKTLISVVGELKVEQQKFFTPKKMCLSCFQVLGFDILILSNLKPILLEVNSNPSLSITTERQVASGIFETVTSVKDEDVKRALVRETLLMVAPGHKHMCTTRRAGKQGRGSMGQCPSSGLNVQETDTEGSVAGNKRRLNLRERDITIRFHDSSTDAYQNGKSVFDEAQKRSPSHAHHKSSALSHDGQHDLEECFERICPSYYNLQQSDSVINLHTHRPEILQSGKAISASFNGQIHGTDPSTQHRSRDLQNSDKIGGSFINDKGNSEHLHQPELSTESVKGDSDDEQDVTSCLKEIYPALHAGQMKHLLVRERLADIFISCLGVRECLRLGPTAFRMFARKCRLNRHGMNTASIDILYIDFHRKWEHLNPDRTSGLCFQGFVDACLEIAGRQFPASRKSEALQRLVETCEKNLIEQNTMHKSETVKSANHGYPWLLSS